MSAYFHSYLCGRKAAEWLINMKKTKILSGILCLMLIASLAIPASAAVVNPEYYFELSNTGTSFSRAENPKYNHKTQPNDPATIYCANTDAPGWGYYLHLRSKEDGIETYNYWYNNTNRLRHPTYVNQAYANEKDYCVWGRIDNDYHYTYFIIGEFNADYTEAPTH